MASFVLFVVLMQVGVFVLGDFTAPKYAEMRKKCISESNVDEDIVDRAKKGDFTLDDNFKNYLKCLMHHESGFDDDGSINMENLMGAIPEKLMPIFEKPVKECREEIEHDGNLGNVAYRLAHCVYTKTLEKFDMP